MRLKTDSLVIIGFEPKCMDQVIQMAGRRSRTMKTHQSIVICINAIATSSNIRELLKTRKPARAVMGCEQSRFYAVVSGLILRATKKL